MPSIRKVSINFLSLLSFPIFSSTDKLILIHSPIRTEKNKNFTMRIYYSFEISNNDKNDI